MNLQCVKSLMKWHIVRSVWATTWTWSSTSTAGKGTEHDIGVSDLSSEKEKVEPPETSVRKSPRSYKVIPARCLSYMVHLTPQPGPVLWEEMQKLSIHEKQMWNKAAEKWNLSTSSKIGNLLNYLKLGEKYYLPRQYRQSANKHLYIVTAMSLLYRRVSKKDWNAVTNPLSKQTFKNPEIEGTYISSIY